MAAAILTAPVMLAPAAGGAPAAPENEVTTAGLLEPLDPVIEDVVVPDVLAPVGDVLGPVVDIGFSFFPAPFPIQPIDIAGDAVFDALGPIQPLHYNYEVENVGGLVITEAGRGRAGIPSLISVSADVLADVSIEVTDIATTPTVRVIGLPGAPSELPLVVRVTVAPEGWGSPVRYTITTVGTLDSGYPDMAKVTVTELGSVPEFSVETVNAGPSFRADVTRTAG